MLRSWGKSKKDSGEEESEVEVRGEEIHINTFIYVKMKPSPLQ